MLSRFEASWDPAVRVRVVAAKAGSSAIVVQSAGITVHLAPGEAVAVTLADGSSDVATQGSPEGTAWPTVVGLTLLGPDRTGVQDLSSQDAARPVPVLATEPPEDHTIVVGARVRFAEATSAPEPEPAPSIGGLAALEASLGRSEPGRDPAFPEAQDDDLDAVDMTVVHSRRARAEALHAAEAQGPNLTQVHQPPQAAPDESAVPAAPLMPAEMSPSSPLSLPDAARPPVILAAPSVAETPAFAAAVPAAQQPDAPRVSAQRPVLAEVSAPMVVSADVPAPPPIQAPASKRGKLSSLLRGRGQASGSPVARAASTTMTTETGAAPNVDPNAGVAARIVTVPGSLVDDGDDQTITVAQLRAAQVGAARQTVGAPEPLAGTPQPLRLQVPTTANAMMSAPGVAPGSVPVSAPTPTAPTPTAPAPTEQALPAFPEPAQTAVPGPAVLTAPAESAEPVKSAEHVESAVPVELPAEGSEAIQPTEQAEPSETALPTPSEDEDATITRADLLAALAEARALSTSDHTVVGLSSDALDADRTIAGGGRRGLAGQTQKAAAPMTPTAVPVAVPLPALEATAAQAATPPAAVAPSAVAESHVEDELTIARSAMFSSPGAPAFLAPAVKRRSTQPTQAPAGVGQGPEADYTTQAPRVDAVGIRADVPAPAAPAGVPSFDPNATGPRLLIVDVDGERFAKLEGTLVIGRTPSVAQVRERDARGVTVTPTGSGVSHSHVSVRRQGGVVLVRDLWSTNGTRVRSSGVPPFRLRDGEEVPVSDGTRIELGDGVSLTVIDDGGQHGS